MENNGNGNFERLLMIQEKTIMSCEKMVHGMDMLTVEMKDQRATLNARPCVLDTEEMTLVKNDLVDLKDLLQNKIDIVDGIQRWLKLWTVILTLIITGVGLASLFIRLNN
jgi:hypothetical protein